MRESVALYKMYHPVAEVEAAETHGQCWHGETIDEGLDLCRYQLIEPLFREYLPKKGRILEAGCGPGRWVFYLFPDKHFDAVISLGVVEHFQEGPQRAFKEARRILKDGGFYFVTVPLQNLNRLLIANPLKELKRWHQKRKGVGYAFEEYRYTRREFRNLLHEAGFEIIREAPDDYKSSKNMGLYVDFPFLRHSSKKWELNPAGKIVGSIFRSLTPWAACAGVMCISRKKV
ncbi:MAG: class I SAM-dependent methyltransferase [Ignavibacteria bacterium]|nr:MAG: class I SAM-dependent methyltransferase [Ignavibacteria bacterium]